MSDRALGPVRVFVFSSYPEGILIVAPAGYTQIALPPLPVPFDRQAVSRILGEAGIDARVIETASGRWTQALDKARKDDRVARAARQRDAEAAEAMLLQNSSNEMVADRAATLARKLEVDERIAKLKATIADAKRTAFTRKQFVPRATFLAWERELAATKIESQGLQMRLGELRDLERRRNARENDNDDRRFVEKLKAAVLLEFGPVVLDRIVSRARTEIEIDDEDDEDDDRGLDAVAEES